MCEVLFQRYSLSHHWQTEQLSLLVPAPTVAVCSCHWKHCVIQHVNDMEEENSKQTFKK